MNLKEMKMLVKMKTAMGESVDQSILDQIAEEEARIAAEQEKEAALAEERKSAFGSIFSDLAKDIGKLMEEDKKRTAEQQDAVDRFAALMNSISTKQFVPPTIEEKVEPPIEVEEIIEAAEEIIEQPPVIEEKIEQKPKKKKTLVEAAVQKVNETSAPSMFVQPDPPTTDKDLKAIQQKLKLLEGWVSKISMAGPGGGAVRLKDLDDVIRSTLLNATDGQVLTYNEAVKRWEARDPSSGGPDGYVLPTASTTVKGGVKIDGTTITIANGVISSPDQDLSGYQTTAGLSANVLTLTANNTVYLGGIAADQYAYANATYSQISWTNPTPAPNDPFKTIVSANSGAAKINLLTGIPGLGSVFSWSFDTTKITFPDATTQNTAATQSDWNEANTSKISFILNKPTIPDITNIEDTLAATGEPMGHEDASQSTISFDAASRTFTIAPVSANFEVWVRGTKHTFTTAQTVTIPNTSDIYYIYFDSNGLGAQTDFFIWDEQAPTALIYFNAATGLAPYFADERHGTTLDWQTHEYLHRTRGAVIANGFSIGNYTVGGAVQMDIGNGTFFDEDLEIDVVHSNTPTPNTWQQDLQGPAQIPMFYLSGTGWVRDNPTGYLNKQGTSRPRYNLLSGGTWSVADIDSNKYGTTFIVATNNLTYPIIGIMSQSSHANQGDAEALEFSDLVLTGFPVAEFRLLYKVVFKADSTHGTLTSVWDLRQLSATTPSAAVGSDHGLLSGLGDNDHPQYQLVANLSNDVAALTSNNALFLGGVAAAGYVQNTDSRTLSGNLTFSGANLTITKDLTIVGTDFDKGLMVTGDRANIYLGNDTRDARTALSLNSLTGYFSGLQVKRANAELWFAGASNTESFVIRRSDTTDDVSINSTTGMVTIGSLTVSNTIIGTTNNSLYLGTAAANQYAYANGSNFSINNPITVTYTGAGSGQGLNVVATNTQGGSTYADFLKAKNSTAGATANTKTFRLNNTGGLEIINDAYTATIFSLTDSGVVNTGEYQVNGKKAVNGPAFSAYPTSPAQTITTNSNVRVNFGNEEYDLGGCYDAPNGKFQPNVEGYYQLNATVRIDGSSGTGERMIVIYKNGAEYKRGTNESGSEAAATFFTLTVSCLAYANGSTDYFQVYVVQSSGGNRTVSEYQQISYFQGCMVRGA